MRRALAGVLMIGLLSGCAIFTTPSETTTIERQQAINAPGAGEGPLRAGRRPRSNRLAPPASGRSAECAKAAQLHEQAKRLGAEVEAKARPS